MSDNPPQHNGQLICTNCYGLHFTVFLTDDDQMTFSCKNCGYDTDMMTSDHDAPRIDGWGRFVDVPCERRYLYAPTHPHACFCTMDGSMCGVRKRDQWCPIEESWGWDFWRGIGAIFPAEHSGE